MFCSYENRFINFNFFSEYYSYWLPICCLNRLELRDEWRLQNRRAFANIWSDMVFGISLFILLYFNQTKVSYHYSICLLHSLACIFVHELLQTTLFIDLTFCLLAIKQKQGSRFCGVWE